MVNSQRMSLVDLRSLIESHSQIKNGNDLGHASLVNKVIVGNRELSQITTQDTEIKDLENLELNLRIKGCLGILKTEILTSILKNEFNEEDVKITGDSNINERKIIIEKILSHLIG
uniref:Uncharacterized protein n=1 Tax=Theileria parva TaxID=5875 RepID=Q4N7E2_THEPA|eukprot:XP_766399.1 hypothetical protein [Theileria parva strain Muguga]